MSASRYRVIIVMLETGERLPCIVETQSGELVRLGTRWIACCRRHQVQSGTLINNARIVARAYDWATEVARIDLDDYLINGNVLTVRHIRSLFTYLHTKRGKHIFSIDPSNSSIEGALSWGSYNHQLAIMERFLSWTLLSDNRGGIVTLTKVELAAEQALITELVEECHVGGNPSQRHEPLSEDEVRTIRCAIGPVCDARGFPVFPLVFPTSKFGPSTQLRNWIMFELAYQLALRRGELLKLRLDSLPRGIDKLVKIRRLPDDPFDTRRKEPAVKTSERELPAEPWLLTALRAFVTLSPPYGRRQSKSPYLFLARSGTPVSIDTANDIAKAIGRQSGVEFNWHRARTTRMELWRKQLGNRANATDILKTLGGWSDPRSVEHYTRNTLAEQANAFLADRGTKLYDLQEDVPW